jgi:signal transduction histidine kinase
MTDKGPSLRLRLLSLAAIGISLVLLLAGSGFYWLYQRHVEKFIMTELATHLDQLLGNVTVADNGTVLVASELSDPRFTVPGGGLYWQIDVPGQESLRSRSLWDDAIVVPTPPATTEEDHAHIFTLANGEEVFGLEKLVIASSDTGLEKQLVITVSIDRGRVTSPVREFAQLLASGLAATYAALLAAALAIVHFGLRPLQAVQQGIRALREGQNSFDASNMPREVAPLAEEVNALVEAREQQVERVRQRASNLAHGLKTPLAVLQAIANELRLQNQQETADHITLNASQMRDLVERELTRSRAAQTGAGAHHTPLLDTCERLLKTTCKAPRGDALNWHVSIASEATVCIDAVDLMELVGNLLDNARKHAISTVILRYNGNTLSVEDDGPGVPDGNLQNIFQRGVRLDEKGAGTGIGLAIVADLADVYGLPLLARKSDLGGLAIDVGLQAQ